MDNVTAGNKFCPNCGAPNAANARFCVSCGTQFDAATAGPAPQPAQPAPAYTAAAPAPAPVYPQAVQDAPSRFTGGAFANFFIGLISLIVTVCSLFLLYPVMKCWKMRWEVKHTCINVRHMVFDGHAVQLYGKYLLWLVLSLITLGIYYLLCMRINLKKWQTKHTHIEGVEGGESKFTGSSLGYLGHSILTAFVTIITLTFGFYWARCHMHRWCARHTIIDGYREQFDGKAIQLFGKIVVWVLLTIITICIYSFWLIVKYKKWITKHTVFAPGQALPPVSEKFAKAAPAMPNQATYQQTPVNGQPAGAPYGYNPQPYYAPVQQKRSNGMAIAGFILSLLAVLGFFASFLIPLLGVIFSSVGIAKSKKLNNGKGLAIAGLILGIFAIIMFACYIFFLITILPTL